MSRHSRIRAALLALTMAMGCVVPAGAHTRSQSFSSWYIQDGEVRVTFSVLAREATRLPPMEGSLHDLDELLLSHLATTMGVEKKMSSDVKAGLLAPYNSWRNRLAIYRFVKDIALEPDHPSYQMIKETDEKLLKLKGRPMLILWGKGDFIFDMEILDVWKQRFPELEKKLRDEYYKLKGWNNDGIPTKESLHDLELDYVYEDFIQRGILSEKEKTPSRKTTTKKKKK